MPLAINDIPSNLLAGARCYIGIAANDSPCSSSALFLNLYMFLNVSNLRGRGSCLAIAIEKPLRRFSLALLSP